MDRRHTFEGFTLREKEDAALIMITMLSMQDHLKLNEVNALEEKAFMDKWNRIWRVRESVLDAVKQNKLRLPMRLN